MFKIYIGAYDISFIDSGATPDSNVVISKVVKIEKVFKINKLAIDY